MGIFATPLEPVQTKRRWHHQQPLDEVCVLGFGATMPVAPEQAGGSIIMLEVDRLF